MIRYAVLVIISFWTTQSFAMGDWWGGLFGGQSRTEAAYCATGECHRTAFQGRSISSGIDVRAVSSEGGSLSEALEHFELFVKNNPGCRPSGNEKKYGLISNLSKGTALNQSYIVEIDPSGKPKVVATFRAGEGLGVGNECGSNESPHGFIKMGQSDYRADLSRVRNGVREVSRWPLCGEKNPSFKHNRIRLTGLERGYNDNLGESDPRRCPDGNPRYARLHPISYDVGDTTDGCKGLPLDIWCEWAPKLINGCAYNYDGSEPPSIRNLK